MKYWVCTLLLIFILTGCNSSTRNASQQQGQHAKGYGGNVTTQQDQRKGSHMLNTQKDRLHPSAVDHLTENTGEVHEKNVTDNTKAARMPNEKGSPTSKHLPSKWKVSKMPTASFLAIQP